METFDIHQWRSEFINEQGEGDEKLDKLIATLTSISANLGAVLGTLPEYSAYIINPKDPANSPEYNELNVNNARDAIEDVGQYITSSQQILDLLKNHIKEKYNFEV
jgi:hypothetical protein